MPNRILLQIFITAVYVLWCTPTYATNAAVRNLFMKHVVAKIQPLFVKVETNCLSTLTPEGKELGNQFLGHIKSVIGDNSSDKMRMPNLKAGVGVDREITRILAILREEEKTLSINQRLDPGINELFERYKLAQVLSEKSRGEWKAEEWPPLIARKLMPPEDLEF